MAAGATGSYTLRRIGPRRMVGWGFVLTAAAVLLLTFMGQHDRPLLLTVGFVLLGFGLQTTLFSAYESMLSEAPQRSAGAAASIGETSYQLGAGMGTALLGSVMNAAYAPGLAAVPGVPEEASRAAANSLGEAYQVAGQLGGAAGGALHQAARHAFVGGLHITLFVSAGLLLLGAVMARRLPRVMECPVDVEEAVEAMSAEDFGPDDSRGSDERHGPGEPRGPHESGEGCEPVRRPRPTEAAERSGLAEPSEPRVPATREAIEPAGSGRPAH